MTPFVKKATKQKQKKTEKNFSFPLLAHNKEKKKGKSLVDIDSRLTTCG